jgi:hypothetical protein
MMTMSKDLAGLGIPDSASCYFSLPPYGMTVS